MPQKHRRKYRESAGMILCAAIASVSVSAQTPAPAPSPKPQPEIEAEFGKGVTIRSSDDELSLNVRARIQVRSTALSLGDERPATSEVLIRRMRLLFQGNALGPTLTYYVQLSFANLDNDADLRVPLRDAFVTWQPARDFNLRVGQMKVPFSRQRVLSSSGLQMVDRSIVVGELSLDRDVGIQLFSRNFLGAGKFGYAIGVFGGEGRNRLGRDAGYLYTARLEAWPFGPFDDFVESDMPRSRKLRLAFGGSVGYNQDSNRPRSTSGEPFPAGGFDYAHAGADVVLKKSGWSLTAELMRRNANRLTDTIVLNDVPQTIASRSGWGAYVQAGCMVTDRLEISGRYGRLVPTRGTASSLLESNEGGTSVSYYVREHNLKVQGDYFYLTTPTTSAPPAHQLRTQFQLFF